jgi:D-3-phosphoglycerate dehydrogenase
MRNWSDLENCRIVRLNATLFPVSEFEASLYEKYNLRPVQVEANSPEEIIPHVEDCDALFAISVSLPEAVVSSLSRCRVISRLGTGTDKIDVAMATREGILVTNVPYFCVEEQADHTMAMMLALARKLPQMARAMVEGAWSHSKRQSRSNQRLSTQTLGLLGFGNSAIATAKRAKGFGMRVIATRRNMKTPRQEADNLGVEMVSLDTLLAESDYVSLHLPLNSETYHMLDDAELGKMKLGAHLINTSRGALVDEMALVKALREGRLSGAGLDTFEEINPFTEDEAPPDHPLLELDNVVLTPHVGAYSVQAAQDVSRGGVQNVVSVLSGHMPLGENIVNPSVTPRFPLADYDAMLFEDDGH